MNLEFERIRGKDGPTVEQEMQEWVDEASIGQIEDVTVHKDAQGHTVYSVFYWESDDDFAWHTLPRKDSPSDRLSPDRY